MKNKIKFNQQENWYLSFEENSNDLLINSIYFKLKNKCVEFNLCDKNHIISKWGKSKKEKIVINTTDQLRNSFRSIRWKMGLYPQS